MGHSPYDPVEQGPAWNAGRKLGAKRPLKPVGQLFVEMNVRLVENCRRFPG
jgi:hypothetical protein